MYSHIHNIEIILQVLKECVTEVYSNDTRGHRWFSDYNFYLF